MARPHHLIRAVAIMIFFVVVAASCASQTVIGSAVQPDDHERATSAYDKSSSKRAVVDSAPRDDKTGQPDIVILLDERTDKGEDPKDPPTIGVEFDQPVFAETRRGGRDVDNPDADNPDADIVDPDDDDDDDEADAEQEAQELEADDEPSPDPVLVDDAIDLTQASDDIVCAIETLEPWIGIETIAAHPTVDGILEAACAGETDERLLYAWSVVATITPEEYLEQIGLFSGFDSDEEKQTTLAFAIPPLDSEGSFQISVNLDYFSNNRDGLFLTMAHEVGHVITTGPSQLDREVDAAECTTYHDRHGCYLEDALMHDWVTTFWGDGLIDHYHNTDGHRMTGADRCALHPGFFGPYAANHPEEDFAESFSAFVFDVPVENPALEAKLAWFEDQPELVEFRERIQAAEFAQIDNVFATCGS